MINTCQKCRVLETEVERLNGLLGLKTLQIISLQNQLAESTVLERGNLVRAKRKIDFYVRED